eukprot:UN01471
MSPENRKLAEEHDKRVQVEKENIRRDEERGNAPVGKCGFCLPAKFGLEPGCEESPTRTVRKTSDHFHYKMRQSN